MIADDPRRVIARSPMSRFQVTGLAVIVGLNALDGFDVLAMSFAAPGLALDWAIDPAALGVVLSMGLIGMGIGSILLAPLADVFGRRPTMLACLIAMALGMFVAASADDVLVLSASRVVTGLGIGAILPSINAMTAELSNDRRRNLSIAMLANGYPAGAVVGGLAAAWLLTTWDWRAVFVFGGMATTLAIPLTWWLVPESISFLVQKRPDGALQRINRILGAMGHAPIAALPADVETADLGQPKDIFRRPLLRTTLTLASVYALHVITFYYMSSWLPKIAVDMGFSQAEGSGVLVWANVGGIMGGTALGLLANRLGLKALTVLATLSTGMIVIAFGQVDQTLGSLQATVFVAGFCWSATVMGLYALAANAFPTSVRTTGTGFMIGAGRAGAVLAPVASGFLFQSGLGLGEVSLLMALGSLIGGLVLLVCLKARPRPIATA